VATLYKRGASWYINYSRDGKQHRESLGAISKQAAERQKRRIEYEVGEGLMQAPPAPLFSEYATDYQQWLAGISGILRYGKVRHPVADESFWTPAAGSDHGA